MTEYLNCDHFPCKSEEEKQTLKTALQSILTNEYKGNFFSLLSKYQKILADNTRRKEWDAAFDKLKTLFKCGKGVPLNGPMIGIPVAIKDSDYFGAAARLFGKNRSIIASIECLASSWNATFADTGLWMGKTFEPVSREIISEKCNNNREMMAAYDSKTTRIGRNYFRQPHHPNLIQSFGLPALTSLWKLKDRPMTTDADGFDGDLIPQNLEKEKYIPYSKTGGIFTANPGISVVDEMNRKQVYQLNYRWPGFKAIFPMSCLVDEIVQIGTGIYLGQLVFATRHYSLGTIDLSLFGAEREITIGEEYQPDKRPWYSFLYSLPALLTGKKYRIPDYGYQNNGFFLMMDPSFAKDIYSDDAFPQLRPLPGESGYKELGYDKIPTSERKAAASSSNWKEIKDWEHGWQDHEALNKKFTTFCIEKSPNESDPGDVKEMRRDGESILQMLKGIQEEISAQSKYEDHLKHFEKLNQLFRSGIAPRVEKGLFQGQNKGCNTRFDAPEKPDWYGKEEPCSGFDYYHGATLNLHWGFSDTFRPDISQKLPAQFFPTALSLLLQEDKRGPNVINTFWASIGRFIFPWAGKSFEKISGRKLSMLLDESDDLEKRYPHRVRELKYHLASWPHYDLVGKNKHHYWKNDGLYLKYLKNGSWDNGMTENDKEFWINEANNRWVFGNNIQDSRILIADPLFRILDMNYKTPAPSLLKLAKSGPSPFVRQGYIFLGVADQESILPMNNGTNQKKRVFQFHYRYPLIGGPVPIGICLDELVEIAEGLFLGQLIYSTAPFVPFHSSVDPKEYKYQIFGYFLLLDDDWECHRQAIKLDTL